MAQKDAFKFRDTPLAALRANFASAQAHAKFGITKPFLRKCYEFYYGFYREILHRDGISKGVSIEVGSGMGFAKELFPELMVSDVTFSSLSLTKHFPLYWHLTYCTI